MSGRKGKVVIKCRDKEWAQLLLPGLEKYLEEGRNVFITDRLVKVDKAVPTPYTQSEAETGRGGQNTSA